MSTLAYAKKTFKTFVTFSLVLALVACGGSGPAGAPVAGGSDGGSDETMTSYSLAMSLVDGSGGSVTTVTDTEGATVRVTLSASDSTSVANEIIEVTTNRGTLFPSSGQVATNSSGIAELSLDIADMEDGEAGTLVVVYTSNDGTSATARLNFTASVSPTNSLTGFELEGALFNSSVVNASPSLATMTGALQTFNTNQQVTTFSSQSPVLYAVRVLDSSGEPVTEKIVSFASTIGSLSPASGEVLTNSNGVAYVALDASGIESGSAGEMTATIGDYSVSKTFAIDNGSIDFGFVANTIAVTLQGAVNNTITDVAPTNVVVTLTDGAGNMLDNEIISVSSSLGSIYPATGNVATFDGVATAQVDINGVDNGAAGTIVVAHTDEATGVTVTSAINFTAQTSSVDNTNDIALSIINYAGTTIDDSAPAQFAITLTNANGQPLGNALVNASSTLGNVQPSSGNVITNASGVANFVLDVTGSENNEAGVVTATYSDANGNIVKTSLNVAANITDATDANVMTIALGDANFYIADSAPELVTINLKDAAGSNLINQLINVSTTLGTLSPASGIVTTDANGNAQVQLDVTGASQNEGGSITASHTDGNGNVVTKTLNYSASITAVGGDSVITITLADADFTILDTTPELVTVNLKDFVGNNLINQVVNVSTTLGTLSPASGNVMTDANGNAVVQLDVTGAQNGEAGTLTASYNDGADSVNKSVNFSASVTYTQFDDILDVSFADGDVTVSDSTSEVISLTLKDYQGNALANRALEVSASNGTLTPAGGVVVTDANGEATISLDVTGSTSGAGAISVTYAEGGITKAMAYNVSITFTDLSDVLSVAFADGNVNVSDATSEVINVTLTDYQGNALANKTLEVSASNGTLTPAGGVVVTDANGEATISLDVTGSTSGAGAITVSYAEGGITKAMAYNVSITFTDLSDVLSVAFADGNVDVSYTSIEIIDISLTNYDASVPRTGKLLSISTSLGSLSTNSVITNGSGDASITLSVAEVSEDNIGRITVSFLDDNTGDTLTKSLSFKVTANPQNNFANYSLDSGFFNTSVLTNNGTKSLTAVISTDNLDANALTAAGSLADFAAARSSEVGATVNAVQNSVYAVRLTDTDGSPIEGVVVSFASTVGSITPSNGQALTNINGIAYVTVSANGEDPGAAGSISASVQSVTVSDTFAVGSVTLQLGYWDGVVFTPEEINATATTLTVGGTSSLTVHVANSDDTLFTDAPLTINFTSDCAALGLATLDSSVTTSAGQATATYQLNGCDLDTDTITATVEGLTGLTASVTVNLPQAVPQAIQFVSATPSNIALKGTGGAGRQEFSTVVFKVVDESGLAISDVDVDVVLSTNLGGITLTGDSGTDGLIGAEALTTNNDGEISVRVNAGNVSTAVRVIATVQGQNISTTSDQLVISTGLPDQDSMSLAASVLSPGGNDFDGFTSTITARAADAFNNPVPEGTAVYFTTEYGSVGDSCLMVNGTCSVTWTSQNPRSSSYSYTTGDVGLITADVAADGTNCALSTVGTPCPSQVGDIFGGHTTILVHALGEETFVDANGDGVYGYQADGITPEVFTDLPEVFIDHNGDGVFGNEGTSGACTSAADDVDPLQAGECLTWQPGGEFEEFVDADSDGVYDWGNGIYNGSLCVSGGTAEIAGDCESQLVYVSASVELNAGGSTPIIGIYDDTNVYVGPAAVTLPTATDTATRLVYVSDQFNGRLPAGTTVEISSDNCKLSGLTSFEVVDTSAKGNHLYPIYLSEDTETENQTGFVSITVSVPASAGGIISTSQFQCNDDQ